MSRRICVARFGAAHGIRGEIRLTSFTNDPTDIAGYGPLESEDGTERFEIETLRPDKNLFVARLKGIRDRTTAERLAHMRLYVPRDRLPPAEEGEFYHADLIGLEAVTEGGAPLGEVVAVHNFGAGDLLEIKPVGGGDTLLVPFTESAVPAIDMEARRIVVIPPALGA